MTLCVAAACTHGTGKGARSAVVLGSDWMVGSDTTQANVHDKLYWINDKQWPVLIAGDVSCAIELKNEYDLAISGRASLEITTLVDVLYEPLRKRKHQLADEYTSRSLGVSYDDFLAKGRRYFPERVRNETLSRIRRIKLGCELILVIFLADQPKIFEVGDSGVIWCEQYACIGAGEDLADSLLALREHDETEPSHRALYHVMEAMSLGARVVPGVGRNAGLALVYEAGGKTACYEPSTGLRKYLEDRVRDLGPKKVRGIKPLGPKDLDRLLDE